MANGAAIREFGNSFGISQIYKAVLIILASCFLSMRRLLLAVGFCFLFLLCFLYQLDASFAIGESVVWAGRAFGILVFYFFLKTFLDGSLEQAGDFIFKLCSISLALAFLNILLGWFGVGSSQYGDGVGGTGFIYAGNELTVLILCCQMVVLSGLYFRRRIGLMWLLFAVFLLFAVMKSTKSAMLGLIIFGCSFAVLSFSSLRDFKYLLCAFPVVVISIFSALFLSQNYGLFDRFLFFYEKLDFWTFIFSGRNVLAEVAVEHAISTFGEADWLFGKGVDNLKEVVGSQVEIDIVDVAFAYGILGVFLFYFIFLVRTIVLFSGGRFFRISFLELMFIVLMVSISFFAGHVVNSGIASIFIGAAFVYFDYLRKSNENRSFN